MGSFLFTGGRFLDTRAGVIKDGIDLLVEGDRVKEVSDRPITSASAQRIDLAGKVLMPGLIDAHIHIFLSEVNIQHLTGVPLTQYFWFNA